MKHKSATPDELARRARKGFRGYPLATISFYGPTDSFASKAAVGVVLHEGGAADLLERWFSDEVDIRFNQPLIRQIGEFIRKERVKSVVMPDRIIGCPHEEGIDYPEGQSCPLCPFWEGRNRWTGELLPKKPAR
jgi:hypothetical protein